MSTNAWGSELSFTTELPRPLGGCGGIRVVGNDPREVFHGCIFPDIFENQDYRKTSKLNN